MKVLLGDEWNDGFLDYHRGPDEHRILVLAWRNLERLNGLYFIRATSPRLVWNYLAEIGPMEVIRKIRSRIQERCRNEKYISVGVGRVMESPGETQFPPGQLVVFVAPSHPCCVERVVLPSDLMRAAHPCDVPDAPVGAIVYEPVSHDGSRAGSWWKPLRGWSSYSGITLQSQESVSVVQQGLASIRQADWQAARLLPTVGRDLVTECRGASRIRSARTRKRAVLFGYGNYAKTVILSNVRRYLSIEAIHEIDPTQIPYGPDSRTRWDTSPTPRGGEDYDVYLIAGYHHTHAPLAIEALRRGACAVVEKPIVVDEVQLADLLTAMRTSSGSLFSCFHKRYLAFNQLAMEDMRVRPGEPVSYHCIVYEVPLPALHWYRWPNSRSRLTSNGCHWLDHFVYLNDFSEVRAFELSVARDGTVNCSVELANGASFTMVLTDQGSERIGVQDYVELRANGVSVKMTNGSDYLAEGKDRIIRRNRINKVQSYKTMYRQIGRKILNGVKGDSLRSIQLSAGLVLALESRWRELTGGERPIEAELQTTGRVLTASAMVPDQLTR